LLGQQVCGLPQTIKLRRHIDAKILAKFPAKVPVVTERVDLDYEQPPGIRFS
jgi:hypothetical protein